ncbi:Uncharacterised protein [Mycobacteroides abscessus subsp. massiliense]|nr:Uncharacterised protein [Mycobacteroides abscessus subsp. massiliense]
MAGRLQRRGTAHDGIGVIDADPAHAHEAAWSRLKIFLSRSGAVVQFGRQAFRIQRVFQNQVAQYAQHFPQRTRIAEALNDTVEGLQTAFHIDEAA